MTKKIYTDLDLQGNKLKNASIEGGSEGDVITIDENGNMKPSPMPSGDTYTGTCTKEVGGIKVGMEFVNASFQEFVDALINPYAAPIVSITSSVTGTKEIGTTVSNVKLTASVTKKTKNIVKIRFYVNNEIVHSEDSNVSGGGDFIYTYESNITSNTTFKVDATDDERQVPDTQKVWVASDTKSITFVSPYYYGVSNSDITSSVITGLTKSVTGKGNKEFSYTASAEHGIFAYPKSYGALSHILDPNGYENISGWSRTELDINGVTYYIYRSNDKLTCNNFKYKFQY